MYNSTVQSNFRHRSNGTTISLLARHRAYCNFMDKWRSFELVSKILMLYIGATFSSYFGGIEAACILGTANAKKMERVGR